MRPLCCEPWSQDSVGVLAWMFLRLNLLQVNTCAFIFRDPGANHGVGRKLGQVENDGGEGGGGEK